MVAALDSNPWLPGSWNITAQGAFIKAFGMAVAQRRASEAGSSIGSLRPPGFQMPKREVYVIKGRPGKDGKDASVTTTTEFLSFVAEGPFVGNEQFMIATPPRATLFPASPDQSIATAMFAPGVDCTFALTDDLANYLADGSHAICTVTFAAGSRIGSFTWDGPFGVPPGQDLWVIAPALAEPTLSGVKILFAGSTGG